MPANAVVTGIVIVLLTCMLIFMVQFFIPLSARIDMDAACRQTLLKMESEGGLIECERQELSQRLNDKGFENVSVNGTESSVQGGELSLRATADFSFKRLLGLFEPGEEVIHMIYEKTCLSRKVLN